MSFSTDSVAMDTVFCRASTRTYDFWVYNSAKDGLRIKEVRLKNPSHSGFRVNVDGSYVDSVAYDFEVHKGDSIRVFVELTAPDIQQDIRRVEDQIIFSLESGIEQQMPLSAYCWKALIYDEELIVKEDMVIKEHQPVVFRKGIIVAKGATLTLLHTQFYFCDNTGIEVNGSIIVDSCLFRGDRLDRMFTNLPYDRISGQWKGIAINGSSKDNIFQDCEIRNSCIGISCEDVSSLFLLRCAVHNCMGAGMSLHRASVTIDSCRISNTLGDCLTAVESEITINHTTLAQFYPFSADRGFAFVFDAKSYVMCDNTLITGYEEDVVMGDGDNFSFNNCIIRTLQPSDTEGFENVIWESPDDEIQGEGHFVTFDTENLYYNFTIQEKSPAYSMKIGDLRTLRN